MFSTLSFIGKWEQWYRALPYRKGLWTLGFRALLACGWRRADWKVLP